MKTVTAVYITDNWHSTDSKWLIAICETKDMAIAIAGQHASEIIEGEDLTEQDFRNINTMGQTQGYEGEGEYMIEEIILNTFIP